MALSVDDFIAGQEAPAPEGHEHCPVRWPSGASRGVQKTSYTHEALIDLIIANPRLTQNQLAEHFGYTASWISQIISSDSFQSRLAERKDELVDPVLRATVEQQFQGIIRRSLAILEEKLNRPSEQIPDNLALRAFDLSTRAAGYGARTDTPRVQVNVLNHLEGLSENLVALLHRKRREADEEIVDVPSPNQTP